MNKSDTKLIFLPCIDSDKLARDQMAKLTMTRGRARKLGEEAVAISSVGTYENPEGLTVDMGAEVQAACDNTVSIKPLDELPEPPEREPTDMEIQVINATTLEASRQLVNEGLRPLALNFANGIQPGGGFLHGALAQEESLCRSSALYQTIEGDPMYAYHKTRPLPDSTDWSILSPDVPVFREDSGTNLDKHWLLSFITCAAPFAPGVGKFEASDLLHKRILRVLAIARAYGYETLVLGAWGCGAFYCDTRRCAEDFRSALEDDFRGDFSKVLFAITDWSKERDFLGPFRDVFQGE